VTELVDEGGELFNAMTFIVFGAIILGPVLGEITWQVVLYAVLSLTVVRMLPVALAVAGTGARRPTVAFLGWFGPRGLASIVFAVILFDDADLPHLHTLLLAITVTIALSVYAHGLSARPLTERYVRWWSSHPRDAQPAMESTPATAAPSRS
jgi:sodium/hydrogen antiporter